MDVNILNTDIIYIPAKILQHPQHELPFTVTCNSPMLSNARDIWIHFLFEIGFIVVGGIVD